jgi:hypothetical protein
LKRLVEVAWSGLASIICTAAYFDLHIVHAAGCYGNIELKVVIKHPGWSAFNLRHVDSPIRKPRY